MSENESTAMVALGGEADDLMQIAAHAEQRIDAVMKIKRVALKVTNAMDWVDQRDKPYLMASGAEKIANLFNISWRLLSPEPSMELEGDGNYTYTYSAEFSMGSRTIHCEGSRSSRDKFFTQYEKSPDDGKTKGKERLVNDRDNKRDVKMSAYTNLLGNGITRILGIRNMTYADLLEFANIKQGDLQKVVYKAQTDSAKSNAPATPTKNAKPADNGKPQFDGGPEGLDVFATLEKELADFCDGDPEAMQGKLQELTSFVNKDGKGVLGKRQINDLKLSKNGGVKWAGSALEKLRKEAAGER